MKTIYFVFIFTTLTIAQTYCGSLMELSNEQEIGLENINSIELEYYSEAVVLLKGNTDRIVLKEYTNRNDANIHAKINNSNGKLTIKGGGRRSFRLFSVYRARIEVYIPDLNTKELTVNTTSGSIKADDEYLCSKINLKSTSGSISVNSITAAAVNLKTTSGSIHCAKINGAAALENIVCDVSAKASSGEIVFENIDGNVFAKTTSGRIKLSLVSGNITAEATSGAIICSTVENNGNTHIALSAKSGSVYLGLPKNKSFNFSSKTASGSLSTPFSDKLFSPISDRKSTQGLIGEKTDSSVNIKTTSGSIKIEWTDAAKSD